MCNFLRAVMLGMAGILVAGCATAPMTPYWSDASWIDELGATVQMHLASSKDIATTNAPQGTMVVGFTYSDHSLKDVHIVQSSGLPQLDAEVITIVQQIQPPPAYGAWANTPHTFAMPLYVGASWTALIGGIHSNIQQHVTYPLVSMLHGADGVVVARFGYRNGQVLDPRVIQSSGYSDLDFAVINELRSLALPAPPTFLRDHELRFQAAICFNRLVLSCPHYQNAVYYLASTSNAQPCSEVGFSYAHQTVTDVRLVRATPYASLDKLALQLVSKGAFPKPAGDLESGTRFAIPVCYEFNLKTNPTAPTLAP